MQNEAETSGTISEPPLEIEILLVDAPSVIGEPSPRSKKQRMRRENRYHSADKSECQSNIDFAFKFSHHFICIYLTFCNIKMNNTPLC